MLAATGTGIGALAIGAGAAWAAVAGVAAPPLSSSRYWGLDWKYSSSRPKKARFSVSSIPTNTLPDDVAFEAGGVRVLEEGGGGTEERGAGGGGELAGAGEAEVEDEPDLCESYFDSAAVRPCSALALAATTSEQGEMGR